MAYSNINKDIKYKEYNKIEKKDINYEAALYEMELYNTKITIALGREINKYSKYNIIYFPIYIIKDDKVVNQIGLYEITSERLPIITDADGDINLELVGDPIFYKFVDEEYILNNRTITKDDKKNKDELEISLQREQTKEEAEKERKDFKKDKNNKWIQNYMNNPYYNITQTKAQGDCLFDSISIGLQSVGLDYSVKDLRKKLSDNYNDLIYKNYRRQYEDAKGSILELNAEYKDLNAKRAIKEKELSENKDRTQQKQIAESIKTIDTRKKQVKLEHADVKLYLQEFQFMKGITTLEAFKRTVETTSYWGDTTAIQILENLLNVKFILLSKESYDAGDKSNILNCGMAETEKEFKPDYYVLLSYTGNHYELITYKDKGALTYPEIPYDIKKQILKYCSKGSYNSYKVIPDFNTLFESKMDFKGKGVDIDIIEMQSNNDSLFYDDNTRFLLGSSMVNNKPGYNNYEHLGKEGLNHYFKLHSVKNWRDILADTYKFPMEIDGKKWTSIAHYYNANKFLKNNKSYYETFSLDSKSDLSQQPELAVAYGTVEGIYNTDGSSRNKNIKIDRDFYDGRHKTTIMKAFNSKFNNPVFKDILVNTKDAILYTYNNDTDTISVNDLLMEYRSTLVNDME